ncbi:hypothetical protein DVA86_33180 [Streptomyces armeniacus]|uniref:ATP-binding protein n=1 Tax=Streptomyces armeniacus TaxID=83291 RepID=A0A345XYH9_9ACTN|nr:hypothetical protein [Streptomyces armeniacus]AXK36695.1 hypothetical protein DVA86_33180 [Streptomyces armeniacus]
MSSRPRHARTKQPRRSRALLRAGLTVTAAGAAVMAGSGMASADTRITGEETGLPIGSIETDALEDPSGVLKRQLEGGLSGSLGPAKDLPLYPLAGTAVDPLANSVGAQVADFQTVSTEAVTGPLASGSTLRELPVLGQVATALPG